MRKATKLMFLENAYGKNEGNEGRNEGGRMEGGRMEGNGRMRYEESGGISGAYPPWQERHRRQDPMEPMGERGRGMRMRSSSYDQESSYPENRQRIGYNAKYRGRSEMDDGEVEEEEEEKPKHKSKKMYAAGMAWTEDEEQDKKHQVDEESARKWVDKMHNEDGSEGEHFGVIKSEMLRNAHCSKCQKWEWYVALNMMYSDYVLVGQAMGVDRDDFYAQLAKAFLCDEDAGEGKLVKYMEHIPKKK